jgi:hypothetical protein
MNTTGPFRNYMHELAVKKLSGPTVGIMRGAAWFRNSWTVYCNSEAALIDVPDGRSLIVIRKDNKAQEIRLQAAPTGWRKLLEQIYNWFAHRYEDIPLAEVSCRDGVVTDVQDTRQFAQFAEKVL